MEEPIKMLVIYDHPSDYPTKWVVRQWLLHKYDLYNPMHAMTELIFVPTSKHKSVAYCQEPVDPPFLFDTLEEARAHASANGLSVLPRDEKDDPNIVESWL